MLKRGKRKWGTIILSVLLVIMPIITAVSTILIFSFLIILPGTIFSAYWLALKGMIQDRYFLVFVSLFCCALLFSSAFSVHKKQLLLPVLSLIYLIGDFFITLAVFIADYDGLFAVLMISFLMIPSIVLTILLFVYCRNIIRERYITND